MKSLKEHINNCLEEGILNVDDNVKNATISVQKTKEAKKIAKGLLENIFTKEIKFRLRVVSRGGYNTDGVTTMYKFNLSDWHEDSSFMERHYSDLLSGGRQTFVRICDLLDMDVSSISCSKDGSLQKSFLYIKSGKDELDETTLNIEYNEEKLIVIVGKFFMDPFKEVVKSAKNIDIGSQRL